MPVTWPPSPLQAPVDRRVYTRYSDHCRPFSLRIITGNSHPALAEDVAALVGYEMRRSEDCHVLTPKVFANGEIDVRFVTCVRGDDVFIIQPTCPSKRQGVNTSLVELLLMTHTARLASAKRITTVVPYMAYSRQSTMSSEGTPIAAAAVGQLISAMQMDNVVTVDLNAAQCQGFFPNVPVTNLPSTPVFRGYLHSRILKGLLPPADQLVMVSIGHANITRARELGDSLGVWRYMTLITRHCVSDSEAGHTKDLAHRPARMLELEGAKQCEGMVCITVVDIMDTFRTTASAVELLMEAGARSVIACATHGLFSTGAIDLINRCEALHEVIVTDTTPQAEHQIQCPKLTVLAISPLLSMAIKRIHGELAEKEDEWDTTEWNEFDFDLAVCPISSVELMPSLPTTPVRQHSNPGPVSPGP
jgi:ribose-phosphate pyrophosphokinase